MPAGGTAGGKGARRRADFLSSPFLYSAVKFVFVILLNTAILADAYIARALWPIRSQALYTHWLVEPWQRACVSPVTSLTEIQLAQVRTAGTWRAGV